MSRRILLMFIFMIAIILPAYPAASGSIKGGEPRPGLGIFRA